MHRLLERQIRRFLGEPSGLPADGAAFLAAVDQAYRQAEEDRLLLERSLDLTSRELLERGEELRRDLAELTRAETVLGQERDFIAAVLDTQGALVVVLDPQGRIVRFNRACEEASGRRAEEVVGQPFWEVVPPADDVEGIRRGFERLVATAGESQHESRWISRAGERRTISWSNRVLRGADGAAAYVIATGIDFTERRLAEAALAQSEERYQIVARAAKDLVCDFDPATQRVRWDDRLEEFLGYPGEEVGAGIDWWLRHLHPDDRPRVESGFDQALAGERKLWSDEYRFRRRDGSYADILDRGYILRDEAGAAVRMVGSMTDITTHKEEEGALRRSEAHYRLLFERNPQPMWVYDLETLRFLAVNQAAVRHYGYSQQEFLAMTLEQIRPAEDLPRFLEDVRRPAPELSGPSPWRHRRKDGKLLDVEITSHAITWSGRSARLVLATDVTERRALEDQLRQSQKIEAVGRLAGGVAHDFNNLLTAVLGYSDLILSQLPAGSPLGEEVEEIRKAGDRAATLTRQLLAFSRRQVLQPKRLNLNAVVAEMHNILRRLIGEHIELEVACAPDLAPVLADPSQLSQVILNLALNARDAMADGGSLRISTANIELDEPFSRSHLGARPGRCVRLTVIDTGCGMDAATREQVFEPFFTTKAKDQGTGLGLSTVYGIVKQSGGYIWVESELGRGTRIDVYLPAIDQPVESERGEARAGDRQTGSETVLLVEDDDGVRSLAGGVLSAHGFEVLIAASGPEALLVHQRLGRPVHLLLTDVVLPRLTGPELAQQLAARQPDLKVLYMSGYNDNGIAFGRASGAGVVLLEKPFTAASLVGKVREVLDAPAT